MNNFSFSNPVKIIFGKDTIQKLSSEIPQGSKVLVVYGGGSIKKNGVFNQVSEALKGFEWHEFGGIEPNPHYETCLKAIELIRAKGITYLLAVGGGSVLDATKFIALGACYNGDPWDFIEKKAVPTAALPLGTVLTLFATGSEMNSGGVITNVAKQSKQSFGSPFAYPKFSVLDPTVTYSLPIKQVGNGIVDAFVHVVEQYVTFPMDGMLQDRMSEAILHVLVDEGVKGVSSNDDYNTRANLMWAASWALNGWTNCGVAQDWATHLIGHEITAFYGLDHAQTLAIVLPGVMQCQRVEKGDKLIQMGERIFNISSSLPREEKIDRTIQAVEDFFESVGVKTHLKDYGLGQEVVEKISARMAERGWMLGERQNISSKMVGDILRMRL